MSVACAAGRVIVQIDEDSPSQDSRVTDYLSRQPETGPFQSTEWRQVVTRAYGHRTYDLIATRDGTLSGVLTLFLIRSPIFGRVLATAPYGSAGAVCADDRDTRMALVEKAMELSLDLDVAWMELKSTTPTGHEGLQSHSEFVDYRLPLAEPETIWEKRFRNRARNMYRRAAEHGLRLEGGEHLFDTFYQIMAIGMRRLGTPVHSRKFYRSILDSFGAASDLVAVFWEDTPISVMISVRQADGYYALYAASLPQHWDKRPNNFMFWETMKRAWEQGASSFELGRSPKDSGGAKFKETWAAEARPLYYEYFLNKRRSLPRIHQDNPRYRRARSVWQRLPLAITTAIGPHLIKGVP
jgi:FemAB-related protein (PEP-CTERM system-associated)